MKRMEEYCDVCGEKVTEYDYPHSTTCPEKYGVQANFKLAEGDYKLGHTLGSSILLRRNEKTSCGSSSFSNEFFLGTYCSIPCFLKALVEGVNKFLEKDTSAKYKLHFSVSTPEKESRNG